MKPLQLILICFGFFSCLSIKTQAQNSTTQGQTARGTIVDRASGNGIQNAEIELLNHSPRMATRTNEKGEFVLEDIPIGHQRFRVLADSFYESVLPELVVAGKELILRIPLDEEIKTAFVTIEAKRKVNKSKHVLRNTKTEAVNTMNAISTRKFDIEEVTRYVGGFGDPARIVTNFPGLFNIDDTQNYIVSRGNSPYGIRWMIEGIPIDNPHHFATLSNTGAIFPLLNNNLLDNSDFVNGAMPAHYGDAYSGVFDINLRSGNNQKYEFAAQLGLYGAELVAEGPFKKGGASFAVAYRYGIFSLLQLIGADLGSNATPEYQDLNFKINIPTKTAGTFSVFGVGGLSKASILNATRDTSDIFAERNIDLYIRSNVGVLGFSHKKHFNKKSYIKTTLSYDIRDYHSYRDTIAGVNGDSLLPYYTVDETMHRTRLDIVVNSKLSPRALLRGGAYGAVQWIDINNRSLFTDVVEEFSKDVLVRAGGYAELEYKFTRKFRAIIGVHGTYWSMNKNSWSVEPRLALNWYIGSIHKISFGYGWHSKTQPMPTLFYVDRQPDGSYSSTNRDLGSTRSHHLVLSYDVNLAKYWALKLNVYGQLNTDIPVMQRPSSFSLINYGAFSIFPRETNLQTTGLAFNYGAELAVEKFFSRGYYGLIGLTYTRAKYQGSDKIWRSSAFDVIYVGQFVAGKEFKIGKQKLNVFYIDLRYNTHGGQPYTPVMLEESRVANYEVRDHKNAYSQRLNPYNRIDVRIGFRFNHRQKKISHHFYIEALNVGFFKNDLDIRYNGDTGKLVRSKQFGFVPIFFYQIRF